MNDKQRRDKELRNLFILVKNGRQFKIHKFILNMNNSFSF